MPTIGKPAPAFSTEAVMPDGTFKTVSLDDYKGKWTVLFFYPLDFTFVCPTELTQFSDKADAFKAINAEFLYCSIDSKFSHLAWTQQARKDGGIGQLQWPLLADVTKQIATDYDVLIKEGGDAGVALRGVFIIDPKGILRQITVNDLPVGRSIDETLRLLQAFQYHEKTGDVVPCSWTPGSKTMVADPKASQAYFKTLTE